MLRVLSNSIKKSPNDKNNYRSVMLKNGLKVILVSDSLTKRSAASMYVGAGSLEDPVKYHGLAHFLEH